MLPLRVYDISCGGIALVDWPDGRAPENHRLYRQCRLLLDDEEPLAADLEVVYVLERTESDGERVRRCGARFVDLPGTLATRVQRYITRLERAAKGAARRPRGRPALIGVRTVTPSLPRAQRAGSGPATTVRSAGS